MRGLAVVFMVECHCLLLLHPSHDGDAARTWLTGLNGLMAPTFILCAGISSGLAAARAAGDRAAERRRTKRTFSRIALILGVSLFIRYHFWDWPSFPERLLWLDVLACIALALAALWVAQVAIPVGNAVRWLLLGSLTTACFAAAPVVDTPRQFGWLTPLLNNSWWWDTWPLIPWAGYVFLGAVIGRWVGRGGSLTVAFAALAVLGTLMTWGGPAYELLYGDRPWMLSNAGSRLWRIGLAGAALSLIEHARVVGTPLVVRWIELLSRQSLWAYTWHLLLLIGFWWVRPFNTWHASVDWWPGYAILMPTILALTTAICYLIDQWPGAKAILRLFLVRGRLDAGGAKIGSA
jgi:uncharacterized membrane protein